MSKPLHSNYKHKPNRRERKKQMRRDRRLLDNGYGPLSLTSLLQNDRRMAVLKNLSKANRRRVEKGQRKPSKTLRIKLPEPSEGGYNKQTRLEAVLGFVKRAKKIKKIMGGSK